MKKKTSKPTIAIVGAGNLGRVLALALKNAGFRIREMVVRPEAASQRRGAALAKRVDARMMTLDARTDLAAQVVWICVTDDAIGEVARALAKSTTDWRDKVVLHASGALSSQELKVLKRKGAAVASLHPMNTFVAGSSSDLAGTPFAVEGDTAAIKVSRAIVRKLGGEVFPIRAEAKVLYHAMGSFASPLLVSLLNAAEAVGKSAGLRAPKKVMAKILRQTVENFLRYGSAAAFSGPIKRGNLRTVRNHLAELRKEPGALEIYTVLARNAVKRLPGREKEKMQKLLATDKRRSSQVKTD